MLGFGNCSKVLYRSSVLKLFEIIAIDRGSRTESGFESDTKDCFLRTLIFPTPIFEIENAIFR